MHIQIEKAIEAGRKLQQAQTGFLHFCYHPKGETVFYTIPMKENFLFALALLRSKTKENIEEAKAHLLKLLPFYSAQNFPTYLHEYPTCSNRYFPAELLPIFYWIIKGYRSVLGKELVERLEEISSAMIQEQLKWKDEAPYTIALRIAASALKFGKQDEGEALLERLRKQGAHQSWYSRKGMGEILIALQMIEPSIKESSWKPFWDHLCETRHPLLKTYVGPAFDEHQDCLKPELTLYDLYTGADLPDADPLFLYFAMIHPFGDQLTEIKLPYRKEGENWVMEVQPRFAMSQVRQYSVNQRGEHQFRLMWGDSQELRTLVCQSNQKISFSDELGQFSLHLQEPHDEDEKDFSLFLDWHQDTRVTVQGVPATTFRIGDVVRIKDLFFDCTIHFSCSDTAFFGHVSRGNRPSQLPRYGSGKFDTFDREIFLRSVNRRHPTSVSIQIQVDS